MPCFTFVEIRGHGAVERHEAPDEEMDVEGILGFAEHILPSASNLWVQSSVAQKQRLQQQFFPDGTRFDGKKIVGTGSTLPVFNYLSPISDEKKEMVDLTGASRSTSVVHAVAAQSRTQSCPALVDLRDCGGDVVCCGLPNKPRTPEDRAMAARQSAMCSELTSSPTMAIEFFSAVPPETPLVSKHV